MQLLLHARQTRDRAFGRRVTYSPKVFIPLTMLCRDKCGYCTFAQPPARLAAPYLSPDDVLAIARRGAAAGCHEALFTLGERPEERYPVAREWLDEHGYASTVDYLAAMCELVLTETGLLPHANAGALFADELAKLRVGQRQPRDDDRVAPRRPRLPPRLAGQDARAATGHARSRRGAVDPVHDRDPRRHRREPAMTAPPRSSRSRESHARHGHVQEVIVQNFLPKEGTAMHNAPPCPHDEYLDAIALARLLLPADVHVQAPPNLSDDFGVLLDAGIDDWGGVSPVTADHVNPERPWPALDRLREVTEAKGFALAPRLTVYPEFALDPERWLDERVRFPVLDRSDAEGLGRDDPGAVFPQNVGEVRNVGDGAEVVLVGRRSTAWYSGADVEPESCSAPSARFARCLRRVRLVAGASLATLAMSARCSTACGSARSPASTSS